MSMAFSRSVEQVALYQQKLAEFRFTRSAVTAEFVSEMSFIKEILPPCLRPPARPLGRVSIAKQQGELGGAFDLFSVEFQCRYDGYEGELYYPLLRYTNVHNMMFLLRELWGENCREGNADIYKTGNHLRATASRLGERLADVEGDFAAELPQVELAERFVTLCGFSHAQGYGFQNDVKALLTEERGTTLTAREGQGSLRLFDAIANPLSAVPIVAIGRLSYIEAVCVRRVLQAKSVGHERDYLAYYYGACYDLDRGGADPQSYAKMLSE